MAAVRPPAASLDDFPMEILVEIASSLDCWSLLSLKRVSERCRDAVALHLGQVNVFIIEDGVCMDEDGESSYIYSSPHLPTREWRKLSRAQKVTLLSRLTGLRELHVYVKGRSDTQWLLESLVTASTGWSRLEKLTLDWRSDKLDPTLLAQLCSNCTRLTDVTLRFVGIQQAVEAVLTARHGELRRLELVGMNDVLPDRLSASLAGCVRLESLSVESIRLLVACLPSDGLPALRHLSLTDCDLSDLALLVERQPRLESVSVEECYESDPSPNVLAPLGRLPALRSVRLVNVPDVSDWVLQQLSQAPLTEVVLGGDRNEEFGSLPLDFWESITAKGLLRLARNCPALRWATLCDKLKPEEPKRTIDCQSDVAKRELIRVFKEHRTREVSCVYCRLGGAPADKL